MSQFTRIQQDDFVSADDMPSIWQRIKSWFLARIDFPGEWPEDELKLTEYNSESEFDSGTPRENE